MNKSSKITASELVLSAIFFLQQKNGVSAKDMTKFICEKRGCKQSQVRGEVKRALEKATENGIFSKKRGLYRIESGFGKNKISIRIKGMQKNKKARKARNPSLTKTIDEAHFNSIQEKMYTTPIFTTGSNYSDFSKCPKEEDYYIDHNSRMKTGSGRGKSSSRFSIQMLGKRFPRGSNIDEEDDDEDFLEEDEDDDDDIDYFSDDQCLSQRNDGNRNFINRDYVHKEYVIKGNRADVKRDDENSKKKNVASKRKGKSRSKSRHKSKPKKRKLSKPRRKTNRRKRNTRRNIKKSERSPSRGAGRITSADEKTDNPDRSVSGKTDEDDTVGAGKSRSEDFCKTDYEDNSDSDEFIDDNTRDYSDEDLDCFRYNRNNEQGDEEFDLISQNEYQTGGESQNPTKDQNEKTNQKESQEEERKDCEEVSQKPIDEVTPKEKVCSAVSESAKNSTLSNKGDIKKNEETKVPFKAPSAVKNTPPEEPRNYDYLNDKKSKRNRSSSLFRSFKKKTDSKTASLSDRKLKSRI